MPKFKFDLDGDLFPKPVFVNAADKDEALDKLAAKMWPIRAGEFGYRIVGEPMQVGS